MAYLNLGTGLAAGIVLDGRLLRGGHGVAGEIGHIPVDPAGVVCGCGQRGCLETLASGSAIARMWPTDDPLPARELFDAADAGDEHAIDGARAVPHGRRRRGATARAHDRRRRRRDRRRARRAR